MIDKQELHSKIKSLEPWFYDFDLGNGVKIDSKLPQEVKDIHETRLEMVKTAISDHFGDASQEINCLDIGCHEGFFSLELANRFKSVTGVDVRKESLEKAELVREYKEVSNVSFEEGNCYDLDKHSKGQYELTLFLGVLYHLDNPIKALNSVSQSTTDFCLIETQVIDEVEGETEWGGKDWHREYKGVFALIDERPEFDKNQPESGSSGVILCPSTAALIFLLKSVGFKTVKVLPAPKGGYEQFVRGKRVIVSASKK